MTEKSVRELIDSYRERTAEGAFSVDPAKLDSFVDDVYRLLLLDYLDPAYTREEALGIADRIERGFRSILERAGADDPEVKVEAFMSELPEARRLILGSAQAIMEGDPASDSIQEIIVCYPGFRAITLYRIANILYRMDLRVMARIISERAHRETGIDIGSGARIGERFFIDHGTGIVIGETAVIGNDVKIYQGVTLGALSLRGGREKLRGVKRHPTIEDGVTIYSNCAIFGGETVIGADSTLGACTTITASVPPRSLVVMNNCQTVVKSKDRRD